MAHAFISYVKDDAEKVMVIVKNLRAHKLDVWVDRDSLLGGDRWQESIKHAIRTGDYFIAVFSNKRVVKERTVAHDELLVAIDELRLRPFSRRWFIPVRLDNCAVPDIPIGLNETINSLQRIDLFPDQNAGIIALLRALQVSNPKPAELQDSRLLITTTNIPSEFRHVVVLLDEKEKCSLVVPSLTIPILPKFHRISVRATVTDVVGPMGMSSETSLFSNSLALEFQPGRLYSASCKFQRAPFWALLSGAASRMGIEISLQDIADV